MDWFSKPFSLSEVEKLEGETFRAAYGRVLNNFYCWFPIGDTPHKHKNPLGLYRTVFTGRDTVSRTMMCENEKCHFSEKAANQTANEKFDSFDACVKEMGIPMVTLSEIINRAFGKRKEEDFELLWNLMIPIYIELRKRGYSPADITS